MGEHIKKSTDGMGHEMRKSAPPQKHPIPGPPPTHLVHGPDKIEWEAHEHEHREHTVDWFWMLWIVAISVAIAALILDNFLFAALAIVSAFVMSLHASKHPELVHFTLSHRGVAIGKKLFPFATLHSFAVKEDPEEHDGKFLLLRSKKQFMPMIIVPIPDELDTREIRQFMLRELPESDLHLPFSERLMELVGF